MLQYLELEVRAQNAHAIQSYKNYLMCILGGVHKKSSNGTKKWHISYINLLSKSSQSDSHNFAYCTN